MTRKAAIIALFAFPLAAWRAFAETSPGVLTLDLEKWSRLEVRYRGRTAVVTADEIFKALLVFFLTVTPLWAQTRPSPEAAVSVLLGSGSELNRTGVGDWESPAPSLTIPYSGEQLPSTPITPSYRGPFVHWSPWWDRPMMRGRYGRDTLPPALHYPGGTRATLRGLHQPTARGTSRGPSTR